MRERLQVLFEWLVDPCLAFVRKSCKEIVPTSDIALPVSLMHTLWSLMDEFREAKMTIPPKDVPKVLDSCFVFALIWSLGASTDNDGRARFNDFLRKLLDGAVERKADRWAGVARCSWLGIGRACGGSYACGGSGASGRADNICHAEVRIMLCPTLQD